MVPVIEVKNIRMVFNPVSYTHLDVYKRQIFLQKMQITAN